MLSAMERRPALAWGTIGALAIVAGLSILLSRRSEKEAPATPARGAAAATPVAAPVTARQAKAWPAAAPAAPLTASAPAAASPLTLTGRVESTSGDPIAGAEVFLESILSSTGVDLGRTTSGADGSFMVDLEPVTSRDGVAPETVFIRARASAPRFRSIDDFVVLADVPWPIAESIAAWNPIVLAPGGTLRGRVVDSRGVPVDGACVAVGPVEGAAVTTGRSDPLGRFDLPIHLRGDCAIHAEKEQVGGVTIAPVTLAPEDDLDVGNVQLRGDGAIGGTVEYPDGSPVRRLDIRVTHESLPPEAEREPGIDAGTDAGIRVARSASGDDGRFAFTGLAPGGYSLELSDLKIRGEPPLRIPIESGVIDARIVVDWHRTRVRVLSPNGARLENAQIHLAGWKRENEARFRSAIASGAGPEAFFGEADWGRGQSGSAVFEVFAPRGSFLYFRAKWLGRVVESAGQVLVADHTYEVPFDSNESAIDVRLEAAVPGRLRLAIRDESGRPVRDAVATLRSKSGFEFAFIREEPDVDGFLPPAIAGDYRLEVEPGAPLVEYYLPIETDVVVVSGEDTTLPLVARSGGRLLLKLTIAGHPGGRYVLGDASVGVVRADATTVENRWGFFRLHEDGRHTWSTGIDANEPWFVGSALAAGAYRVAVTASGFDALESPFTIEAGRVTDVTLELKRRE